MVRKAGPEPPERNRWQDVAGTELLAEGSGTEPLVEGSDLELLAEGSDPEPLTKNCGYRYRLPGKRFTGQPVFVSSWVVLEY